MKILSAFDPVHERLAAGSFHAERLGTLIRQHTLSIGMEALLGEPLDLALVFISDSQENSEIPFTSLVREHLYNYYLLADVRLKMADLGNLRPDWNARPDEDQVDLWTELLGLSRLVVCVGGDQHIGISAAQALARRHAALHVCLVDACFDVSGFSEDPSCIPDFIDNLLQHLNPYLGFLSFIGIQNFLNAPTIGRQLDKFLFDVLRLSEFRKVPEEAEPLLRLSNFLSFDFTALEAAYIPEILGRRPNGFNGVEACRLTRYAGFAPELRWAGFHNTRLAPGFSGADVSAQMMAQMLWHLIEGLSARIPEQPSEDNPEFTQFFVPLSGFQERQVCFYRHNLSGRWWMEIPGFGEASPYPGFPRLIPCSYTDYQTASRGEWPERWWKALQRFDLGSLSTENT
ncbi:MAG: arginase family protein [Flavobacteriales bacterium]|nr:arginase family protein [Flavobacteriales bacterium]